MKNDIIRQNVSLKDKNTFKIDGIAKYYVETKSKDDILAIIQEANKINLPFFILGQGSNTLISNFNGIIIKHKSSHISDAFNIESGALLSNVVKKSIQLSMTGLEWAIGIPGTIGGAIYGNAGVGNFSIGSIIESVEIFNGKEIQVLNNKECLFSYRASIFKKNKNWIILSCKLKLKQGKDIDLKVKDFFNKRKVIKGNSLGSIFKNPEGCYAGELIEKCNLKGKRVGGVVVSEEHANWIINDKNGTSEDVKTLISLIKKEVKNKFNIELKEEIQYIEKI